MVTAVEAPGSKPPNLGHIRTGTRLAVEFGVMSTPHKSAQDDDDRITRPAHDEWGVYDPEQAGFEAILKKLSTKKKPAAVPDQAKPKPSQTPTVEDNGIWMTPPSAAKPGSK
ncbi:MAG TPA: hypothetical protein VGY57_01155 [Vicinamibacterales bacterium]|jgi:hypothetical protein|nr:hypothetical protein [Vicinamibacterales bacterium]